MKNLLLKLSTLILFSTNITACEFQNILSSAPNISGAWENVLKNNDGSTITTTLNVKDVKKKTSKSNQQAYLDLYNYSASISSSLNGTESENVKLTTKNINISGEFRNDSLNITDVESENESITTNSKFILSKDNKYLTLIPGDVKFKKKV